MKGVKRGLAILLLLAVTHMTVFSQATVAKLKFEEAEEAYVANDFTTALEKLDETEKMLGATNPRILYLRIMTEYKLMKSQPRIDLEAVSALKKNSSTYLVKYETVEGIEDKYKEIYKISEAVKSFNTEDQAFANDAKGVATGADLYKIGNAYDVVDNDARAVEWYLKAAAKNNSSAFYALSIDYMNGLGVTKDTVKGMEWLNKAVAANNSGAWYTQGMYYKNGRYGLPADEARFKECMQKSYDAAVPEIEKGNALSMYYAAKPLVYGKLDTAKGIELLTKAVAKGDFFAMDMLAGFYRDGYCVTKDASKAVQLYQKAADKGYNGSMYSLAYMYYRGADGIPNDYNKAIDWFTKAAEHGNAGAAYMLGYIYVEPKGVPQDLPTGISWYKLACDRGSNSAMNNMGNLYYWGTGVTKDYSKAVLYYGKSADLGNVIAMNNAGNTYFAGGNGLTQNYAKAAEFYLKGVAAGYHWCMFNYANMLYDGKGMATDYVKAARYYEMAAEKDNTDAMDKLYSMYYNGYGIKKDKKIAQQWADKAAAVKAKG